MKVFIAFPDRATREMFISRGWEVVPIIEKVDLICFTGGADVGPQMYGQHRHPSTHIDNSRDVIDAGYFNIALAEDIPMVGICRGGQLLNVLSGGSMYQDVDNHTNDHVIKDLITETEVFATSTHHQMMRPSETAVVVATAQEATDKVYMNEHGTPVKAVKPEADVEVCYYPTTRALCFQPHPEYRHQDELADYFFELIESYLL